MEYTEEEKKAIKAYYEDLISEGLLDDMSFSEFLVHIKSSDWFLWIRATEGDQ